MDLSRLEDLRDELGYTKRKVAGDMGVSSSIYGRWENNKDSIPTKRLYQLGDYFKVNVDYLLRLTNKRREVFVCKDISKMDVANKIRIIREELGYSLRGIALELATSNSTWSAYETGKTLILGSFLVQVCQKGNYSVDWVLGRSEDKFVD